MVCEQLKLDNQVCFRLYTVARLITQGYQPWLSKLGITYTQYIVLMVLWEKDHQPVNDIARRLLLETNTVTPLIKRMETEKIVVRRKDKQDARKTIVSLTERGKAMQEDAAEIPGCMSRMLMESGLTAETFATLVPALDEIIQCMKKE
ncbi:MAG: MarR family transcriptional regulator [Prevotella sp.]|nr:MarR family transcriptional regulator [Prevotella sp.]